MADDAKWYVAHTYSGYENKVKANIEKSVENRGLQHLILNVEVPVEDVVEERENKEAKTVKRKLFPGYVVIKMVMTDESWYIVRNTRGVTGFVGSGTDPIPLTDEEIRKMGFEDIAINVDYNVNDNVQILGGPLNGYTGIVQEINKEKNKVKVLVSMFGRETPVELEFSQVQKLD